MASTSAELAHEVLEACLRDGTWPSRAFDALIERALDETDPFAAQAAARALFGIVVERLADLFDPDLCDLYARLFAQVIMRALPEYDARDLITRYRRIRQARLFAGGEVNRVYVLSRVTLGADVAVTSVFLDAAKKRFPEAEILLLGPEKNAGLFAANQRIGSVNVAYGRAGLLRERLAAAIELQTIVDQPGTIVIDPDSRLTQLGLIPICDDARYYFFESRGYGRDFDDPLPQLASQWARDVFNVEAKNYVAPHRVEPVAPITLSVGVGENSSKRLDAAFETELVRSALTFGPVLLDCGAGGEEADRVNNIADALGHPPNLHLHDGSYASFAGHIVQSKLYIGYDSAGQHVACAARVPLVSIFAGYVSDRMFQRWRPVEANARVIRVDDVNRPTVLHEALAAIAQLGVDKLAT